MGDEKYAVSLLRKYIKIKRRTTPYPNIPNIAEACRKLITDFLKQHGEPCSYNRIKEIVDSFDFLCSNFILFIPKFFYILTYTTYNTIRLNVFSIEQSQNYLCSIARKC